jgi:hypothetical protein
LRSQQHGIADMPPKRHSPSNGAKSRQREDGRRIDPPHQSHRIAIIIGCVIGAAFSLVPVRFSRSGTAASMEEIAIRYEEVVPFGDMPTRGEIPWHKSSALVSVGSRWNFECSGNLDRRELES